MSKHLLGSAVNLIPLPKISLFWFELVTQHDTPAHKPVTDRSQAQLKQFELKDSTNFTYLSSNSSFFKHTADLFTQLFLK